METAMAEKRIVEIELQVERANVPFVDTEVASYKVDRTGLRIDDTVGPLMNIIFKKCPQIEDGSKPGWNEKKLIWIWVKEQQGEGRTETVFERTLMEYDLKQAPVFQRYRVPFNSYEFELHNAPELDRAYVGNPNKMLQVGNSVNVHILSPFQIDPKKTKIVLQFVELRGHIGPAAIKIK